METVPPSPPPPGEFNDRKNAMVLFGAFTILMGGFWAVQAILLLFGRTTAQTEGAFRNGQGILPVISVDSVMAVAVIWLGIGSIMARRWARALLLIISWSWLILGVYMMLMFLMTVRALHESAGTATILIMTGVISVVIPAIWVSFYQSDDVKATCEAHDPVTRWTDRCPLPVLAVSLWMAFCIPTTLMMAWNVHGMAAVFGTFVTGPLAFAIYILHAAILVYCAWAFYKLDLRGWWVITVCVVLFAISALITYSRHDPLELFASLGYSPQKISQLQSFGLLRGRTIVGFTLIITALILGYLVYVRDFFLDSVKQNVA